MELIPSERLLNRLRAAAEAEGKSLEELVAEALYEYLNIKDPEAKMELHLKLCEKYLSEGASFLDKGDYVQASEKFWGAAAQMLKALAARKGLELKSHRELWSFIAQLRKETGDEQVSRLWHVANSLHTNFYEAWSPPELIKDAAEDVKRLIDKIRKLMR